MADRELVKSIHHPTVLLPLHHLQCSCGYVGNVVVSKDPKEPSKCPNCSSPTVHEKHVKEKATTIEHYNDGTSQTLVAQEKEEAKIKTSATPTVEDINKIVESHPVFGRLSQFLDEQDKKKSSKKKDAAKPKEGVN